MPEIRVGPHVGRVLAAELETHTDEALARGRLYRASALDGSREGHVGDARIRHHSRDGRMRRMHVREDARRQPRRGGGGAQALGHQRRLVRVLEQHRIAREQRRDDGVHRRQPRVVPGREHEHEAERLAVDGAPKALLRARVEGAQRRLGEPAHGRGAVGEARELPRRIARGPAHLQRQLPRRVLGAGHHGRDEGAHLALALLEGEGPPGAKARPARREGRVELSVRSQGALDEEGAVDGRNRALELGHERMETWRARPRNGARHGARHGVLRRAAPCPLACRVPEA